MGAQSSEPSSTVVVMLIVTTDGVAGYQIKSVLGEVLASALQSAAPQPAPGSTSGTFRVTGEQPGADLAAVRREAVDRLREQARGKGANAVVGMRFDTAAVAGGLEVCAYGTAVWAEPLQQAAGQHAQPQQQAQQSQQLPPYGDPKPGGPPMAARNLTMGIGDLPR